MDVDFLFRLLLWSLVVNYAILLVWFAALVFARKLGTQVAWQVDQPVGKHV